jgi:S-adenosyl-L-methionine hydrolase (adenosine-forming)
LPLRRLDPVHETACLKVPPILTLTSDFGWRDPYVAAMKAVALSINPGLTLVDVSHEIRPQDVMEAAYVLKGAIRYFPQGTVHLVVVDPGVGTDRRAVGLRIGGQLFVGPDNGLFTLLLNGSAPEEAVQLTNPAYWRVPDPSRTFHGRDVFAPVAAHLTSGRRLTDVGTPLVGLEPLHWALPISDDQGIRGWVVHVDRFGNCITNITRELFEAHRAGRRVKCYVGTTILSGLHGTYSSVVPGEPVALFGSEDTLEVAVNGGNAADLLSIRQGAPVNVVFLDKR